MKHCTYSHMGGLEALSETVRSEIAAAIAAIDVKLAKKCAPLIREAFLSEIHAHGWSGEVLVSRESNITITSVKERIGLCLQTGNIARMYADILKLQTMYLAGAIRAAIIVVPSAPVGKMLGSNIANAGRLERELKIFRPAYSTPTLVFSLE